SVKDASGQEKQRSLIASTGHPYRAWACSGRQSGDASPMTRARTSPATWPSRGRGEAGGGRGIKNAGGDEPGETTVFDGQADSSGGSSATRRCGVQGGERTVGRPKIEVNRWARGGAFYPEEISAMVLTKMKTGEATRREASEATKDAGAIAGLNVLADCERRPTAAALGLRAGQSLDAEEHSESSTWEAAHSMCHALTFWGGEDFDNRLVRALIQEFKAQVRKDMSGNAPRAAAAHSAERAKRTLSSSGAGSIEIDSLFEASTFTQRDQGLGSRSCALTSCSRQTMEPVRASAEGRQDDKSSVQRDCAGRGSTRMPKVQKLLQEFMGGRTLNKSHHRDEAVGVRSRGGQAAVLTATCCCLTWLRLSPGHRDCRRRDDQRRGEEQPHPRQGRADVHHVLDNQSGVTVQGERALTGTTLAGPVQRWTHPASAARGVPQIEVTPFFDVDANGILGGVGEGQETTSRRKDHDTNDKGRLSKDEIERWCGTRRSSRGGRADASAGGRNQLECSLPACQRLQGRLGERRRKVPRLPRHSWLENNQTADKDEIAEQQRQLSSLCSPLMAQAASAAGSRLRRVRSERDERATTSRRWTELLSQTKV
uniref:EF-hand domain-containing protein n=1 Tax=Macrostomum lignano TaxID=282301 RepID=A0A1I8F9B8_9PLAT